MSMTRETVIIELLEMQSVQTELYFQKSDLNQFLTPYGSGLVLYIVFCFIVFLKYSQQCSDIIVQYTLEVHYEHI